MVSTTRPRPSRTAALVALLLAAMLATAGLGGPTAALAGGTQQVVVDAGDSDRAAALVAAHGGDVQRPLELIGAVAATLPTAAVDVLDGLAGVTVTEDHELSFTSAVHDSGLGATELQALQLPEHFGADSGAGVGVALIDTGVAETPDLAGRVVHGPDYSDEGDGIDRYGHGTFMAGLIAGDGTASDGAHVGAAPAAHIVSLKLAGADGTTTLSRLLDAIGWVVTHQDEHGIRVLNLSVGAPSNRAPQADPLSAAIQAAWASGITVVAAAGNDGDAVTTPGRDPWAITVGATDTHGTVDVTDHTVPEWSGRDRVQGHAKPELLAPGTSVVSLRAPGSHIDQAHPDSRVGDHYFTGTGTSMSTALVSGAVATLLEFRPWATPDDVKGALVDTGRTISGEQGVAVDLAAADDATADAAWHQGHRVVHNRLGPRFRAGMPWASADAPGPDHTWQRIRWADDQWQRIRWADGHWQRIRWADDASWERIRWADDVDWSRIRWADGAWQRIRWADDAGWERIRWADDTEWQRIRWAGSDWQRIRWAEDHLARIRWADDTGWARIRWADGDWQRIRWADQRDASSWLRIRWAEHLEES